MTLSHRYVLECVCVLLNFPPPDFRVFAYFILLTYEIILFVIGLMVVVRPGKGI